MRTRPERESVENSSRQSCLGDDSIMAIAPHVALVDDDPDLRLLARSVLELELKEGCEFSECASGQEILDVVNREHVDVVVLDLHMPAMSGLAVLEQLTALDDRPQVVAWSADSYALRAAARGGAEATVAKGIDCSPLALAVHECLMTGRHLR